MKPNKRDLIIEAAIRVLQTENYQNMKTAAVAAEAEVAEGTIYRYFKNKRDLFIAVLKEVSERLLKYFTVGISSSKSLRENLDNVVDLFLNRTDEINDLYWILNKSSSEYEDKQLVTEMTKMYLTGKKMISRMIEWELKKHHMELSAGQSEIAFLLIWGVADMMWRHEKLTGIFPVSKKDIDDMLDIFLKLLDNPQQR